MAEEAADHFQRCAAGNQQRGEGVAQVVDADIAPTNDSDQKSMLEKLDLPEWKNRKVADITPTDVDRLLTKIAAGRARPSKKKPTQKRRKKLAPPEPTPVRANRAGEMLHKMFNLAMLWKMRPDNPTFGFRRRPEVARDRFLSFEEMERLANALAVDEDQRAASIIRLCMLTGARLGEVRTATFDRGGCGNLNSRDKWIFRVTAA